MPQTISETTVKGAAPDIPCDHYSDEGWASNSVHVPVEMDLTIYVNGEELVTILCTPTGLNCLVLGFLYAEGIISAVGDISSMRVCEEESLADVRLRNAEYTLPTGRKLTTGCGGGTSFKTGGQRVDSDLVVAPATVLSLMKQFQEHAELYRLCGGIHGSALYDIRNQLVAVHEDIGRHNTLDKIMGECLLRRLSTSDGLLLSTGRISSEMLLKTASMQVPVVVSRTSPTERAVALAVDLGIALVGYARGNRMSVYSHPERLGRPASNLTRTMKSGRGTH